MKNIKAICEYFKINNQTACQIFNCSIGELQMIFSGEKDLSINSLYELIKITDVSMNFVIEGVQAKPNDSLVANYIIVNNKSNLIQSRIKDFMLYLGDAGIDAVSYPKDLLKVFNDDFDEVDGEKVLLLNDYKLYLLLKEKYHVKTVVVNNNGSEYCIHNWKDCIDIYLEKMILNGSITEPLFVQEFKEPKDLLLEAYRFDKIKWNSKAILHLIALGSKLYITCAEGLKNPDMLSTKLLKDYCLNHIEE